MDDGLSTIDIPETYDPLEMESWEDNVIWDGEAME